MLSYAKRKIDVTINLGDGEFGEQKGKDVTLSGLRVSAGIEYINGAGIHAAAQIRIFGLPLSMINQLTGTGPGAVEQRNNRILLAAGDEGGAMSVVYQGGIRYAYGNFQSAPNATLDVIALGGAIEAIRPVNASSYSGNVDAAVVMSDLAKMMGDRPNGLAFENPSELSVMLSNPYFHGTAWEQAKACAKAANISFSVEMGKLVIWPRNGFRKSNGPIKISRESGMIGYPAFAGANTIINTIFNPDVVLGGQVDILSEFTPASGVWNNNRISHALESETPDGQWFTQLSCSRVQP